MEEKKKIKVSLSLLIIILFIVIAMVIGFYIYQKNIKNNLTSNDEIVEDYSNQELEESLYEESNRVGIVEIVKENNKYGIINSETKEVILKPIYDEIKIEDIGIIKARIENEIKEGVVNTKTGKLVLDVIYEENSFGKWVVEDNYINYYQEGMNGLVDIDKGIVIDAKYEYPVGSFIGKFAIMCEGGAAIMIKNVDSGEEYTYEEFFYNSLAYGKEDEFCLKKDGKVQIIDANTNKVLASTKMDLKELYQVENTNYYIGFDYNEELILFNNKLEIIQKVKLPQGIYTSDSHAEAGEEENKIIFNANVYTNEDVYMIDITTGELNKEENLEESKQDEPEFSKLMKYIEKIYPKPGYESGIPKFDNIKDADKEWIWSVAIRNVSPTASGAGEEEIKVIAKELFGNEIGEFPGENESLYIFKYEDKYEWAGDQRSIPEVFKYKMTSISSTNSNNKTYIVGIVEYMINNWDWADGVWIGNLNGEKIKTFTTSPEEKCDYKDVEEYVMKNLEKFDSKTLTIEYDENENQYRIISVK